MVNKPILYHLNLSPPCRAVRVVAKVIGLELELREVNLFSDAQLEEPFRKLNPEHTVPTLDDNGFIVWESHAICAYLIDKYAKDDKLYPKDLNLRAKCNQRLFFDTAKLFVGVVIFFKPAKVSQDKIDNIYTAYDVLETFLATDPFLVGESLTIADICASITVPFLDVFAPIQATKYPKILDWMDRVKNITPFFEEINGKCTSEYRQHIERNKLKQ